MKNDNHPLTEEHKALSEALIGVLDTRFLKALCDPTRIEILKKIISIGVSDVSTIARGLSQDRSVISRHLAQLEQAGITVSRKDGRRVLYDLDGPYIVEKVTKILNTLHPMADLCRPFEGWDGAATLESQRS